MGVLQGIRWTAFSSLSGMLAQLAFVGISSRLLDPRVFGVFAACNLVLRIAAYFSQGGVGQALVQRRDVTASVLSTGLSISLMQGVCIGSLCAVVTPWVVIGLGVPDALFPLLVMCSSLVISCASSVAAAMLRRGLMFRRMALVEVCSVVVSYGIFGPLLIVCRVGIWSLVGASLMQSMLLLLGYWRFCGHRPRLGWDRGAARELVAFGGRVSVVGLLEYVCGNIDVASVVRFLGVAAAGQYSRAASLCGVGMTTAVGAISKVLMPAMARHESTDDAGKMAVMGMTGILVPFGVLTGMCFAGSKALVDVVLGPGWSGCAAVLPYYLAGMSIDLSCHFIAVAMEARGFVAQKLRLQLIQVCVVLTAVPVVAVWTSSLKWTAASWACCELFRLACYIRLGCRHLGIDGMMIGVRLGESVVVGFIVWAACTGSLSIYSGSAGVAELLLIAGSGTLVLAVYCYFVTNSPWVLLVRSRLETRSVAEPVQVS